MNAGAAHVSEVNKPPQTTVTLYGVYDSGGRDGVVLQSTEAVVREKTYFCAKDIPALGYRRLVPKKDPIVGLTPQEAVSKYMTTCSSAIGQLEAQADTWRRRMRAAFLLEPVA